jgi:hypothetical protein
MALAFFLAGAAQGNALVNEHVVADLGRLADHHAHAVVNEETPPDASARVDFDSCEPAAELGDETRNQRYAPAPELVRQPVQQDGMETGITQQDFENAACCGVFAKDRLDLLFDGAEHPG